MASIFRRSIFTKSTLQTLDGKRQLKCFLKSENGDRFSPDLLRNQSEGFVNGFLVEPELQPEWLIPGVILKGKPNNGNIDYIFTVEPSINLPIEKARKRLGDYVRLSWVLSTEYDQ